MKTRCNVCRKKLRLGATFECKCSLIFCRSHLLACEHNCTHDFKTEQRNQLRQQLVLVAPQKLDNII